MVCDPVAQQSKTCRVLSAVKHVPIVAYNHSDTPQVHNERIRWQLLYNRFGAAQDSNGCLRNGDDSPSCGFTMGGLNMVSEST